MMRTAISPRLAIRTLRNTVGTYHECREAGEREARPSGYCRRGVKTTFVRVTVKGHVRRRPTSYDLPFPDVQALAPAAPAPVTAPAALPVPAARAPAPPPPSPDRLAPRSPRALEPAPEPPRDDESEPEVLSVAELDRRLRRVVEAATSRLRVEGEVSGLRAVASGHLYFTLKDEEEDASIACAMFRTAPARARRLLAEGARVVIAGRATVYAPRGQLQLVADDARLAGRGALLEALDRLRKRLAAEGLFAPERKRALPADPRVIGVVTSGDGAAIHDIVTVAFRRGGVRILLARAPVQGAHAAERLVQALERLQRVPEVEVIVIGRGGGSSDDLAVFNDEALVRAAAASRVPVVSAVGHEIDVTLLDLAADARAATPSQAAEMLVPDAEARRELVDHLAARLARALRHRLTACRADMRLSASRVVAARRLVEERQVALDDLTGRLEAQAARLFTRRRAELSRLQQRLAARHPTAVLAAARGALGPLEVRLAAAMQRRLARARRDVASDAGRLEALSPLAVLARGYAIVQAGGHAVRDPREVREGDRLHVRVHRGTLSARVIDHVPEEGGPDA
jgi:exodeoxyribonuclease VII large subunit